MQASPLDGVLTYHARAESFANSMPENHALQVLQEFDEAEGLMWTDRGKSQEIGAVIQAVFQKRAHVWVWHDEPNDTNRSEPLPRSEPPVRRATQAERKKPRDAGEELIGTWATHLREGKTFVPEVPEQQVHRQG